MLIRISFCLALAAVVLAAACSTESPDENRLSYRMKEVQRVFPDSTDSISDSTGVTVLFKYPEVTGAPADSIRDSLNSIIVNRIATDAVDSLESRSLEAIADTLINEYVEVYTEFPDNALPWVYQRKIEVATDTLGIFAVEHIGYSFTGGAHPNSFVYYYNFDIRTAGELALDDLFIENYRPALDSIAEEHFRSYHELGPEEDIEEAGFWFEGGHFRVNDNFLIETDGLRFYFNPYEVAPYAAGPTEITVPYADLEGLVLEDGPLAPFVRR